MSPTTYLVTGANRGIGRALVETYAARQDSIVIAAVRDPTASNAKSLASLPTGKNTKIIIVKIDSFSTTDALSAVEEIKKQGITSLDTVVANAGISKTFPQVHEAQSENMMEHYQVNVIGTALLFAAVRPLLLASDKAPRFITIGSTAGTLTHMADLPIPNAAYGPSKVAAHWIASKIHHENESIIAFPLHPGFVQTDMGNNGAQMLGLGDKATLTIEESVPGVVKVIDSATREKYSGQNVDWLGRVEAW